MNKYVKEELERLIFQENLAYEEIGRKYNVTGNAIKKAAKRLGLELPQRRKINETETFNKQHSREIRLCYYCGNKLNSNQEKFCTRKCKTDFEYDEYINEWKLGNISGQKGKDGISRYIVRYLKEKNNNQCQKCGWHEINPYSENVPVQIHHINGDALDNSEENLELLCPNCHSLTDNYGNLNENSTRTSLKELRETTRILNS